ncbi:MAG: hypothetical protein KAJ19_15845 [Gammaproteobacteria bacterium]|nr:hypothetical protein [Gammaproteobacteria bacterium]
MIIYYAGNAGGGGKGNPTEKMLREESGKRLFSYHFLKDNGFQTKDRFLECITKEEKR